MEEDCALAEHLVGDQRGRGSCCFWKGRQDANEATEWGIGSYWRAGPGPPKRPSPKLYDTEKGLTVTNAIYIVDVSE